MKKKYYELKDCNLETVEDMIKALMKVPKGYLLHPLGQKCAMAVNNYHKCIQLDDPCWVEGYEDELKEEILANGDDTEIEVEDSKLQTYSLNLCVVMGYIDLCQNGNYEAQLMGVFSTDELAKECGDELVEAEVVHHYEIEHPLLDEFGYK